MRPESALKVAPPALAVPLALAAAAEAEAVLVGAEVALAAARKE